MLWPALHSMAQDKLQSAWVKGKVNLNKQQGSILLNEIEKWLKIRKQYFIRESLHEVHFMKDETGVSLTVNLCYDF